MKNISVILAFGILMAGCSENELYEQTNGLENEPLRISASVSDELTTRADGDFPTEVSFNFLYTPAGESAYKAINEDVKFNSDGNNVKTYLTWEQVKTGNNLYLILDNVNNNNNSTTVTLDNETYNAKPEEDIGKGNDILWKSVKVEEQNLLEPVHFELQHVMSKLTFKINSTDETISNLLSSGKVILQLWNVVTNPTTYSFNRLNGNITINGSPISYDDFQNLSTIQTPGEDYPVKTKSWIFPPQQFLDSEKRPTIQIKLSDSDGNNPRTFTGVLPESMTTEDEGLKPLEFLSGYHLVINVELGDWTDQSIHFEPVLVKKWKEYGPKDINIKQVGVYDAAGLEELVKAWNGGPEDNKLTLMKYGVLNGDTWTFDLWANIELEFGSTIEPNNGTISLQDKDGFKAIINNHNHTISKETQATE